MASAYDINDLIQACGKNDQVVVVQNAQKCAQNDFGLNTIKTVLEFISNQGLEKLQLINTKKWEQNPDPNNSILVDAYSFYSGPKQGYIAFFFSPKTGKWIIKSFKQNKYPVSRNNSIATQLLALGINVKAGELK